MVGARSMTDLEKHASDPYAHQIAVPTGDVTDGSVFRLIDTGNIFGPSTAGNDSLTGDYNFAAGDGTLISVTSGHDNICIGQDAGAAITDEDHNVMIGNSAGWGFTAGDSNVLIGNSAGGEMTGGADSNVFIGSGAGGYVNASDNNVGLGSLALDHLDGGFHNVAFGWLAGTDITSGDRNFLGLSAAGSSITTGSDNIVAGENGLNSVTTGDGNVSLGAQSGNGVSLGSSKNVFLGFGAGPGGGEISNLLYIDNHETTTPLIKGDFSAHTIHINGTLSKTAGTFKIDHPLDESKHLIHGFIEGPEYGLLYRGEVTLIDGKATVDIDEACGMSKGIFEAIAQNPTFYLQNTTGFDNVIGNVQNAILTIEAQNPSSDVISWLICAERKDEFVMECAQTDDAGHLILEPERSSNGAPTSS